MKKIYKSVTLTKCLSINYLDVSDGLSSSSIIRGELIISVFLVQFLCFISTRIHQSIK